MLKNYIKTAWRNLTNNKFYSIINICGLAFGLATGIMLLLWVQNEKSYDQFNKDYQDIYQVSSQFNSNGKTVTWTGVPGPLSVYAKSIPQVKSLVRIMGEWDQILSNADRSKLMDGNTLAFVDSTFFSIFSYELVKGNISNALPNDHSVILTQKMAEKLFGKEESMGKIVMYEKENFEVTGVLKDFPQNSTLQYDAIFPMSYYAKQFTSWGGNGDWKTIDADLGNYAFNTYVKLQAVADPLQTGTAFSSAYKNARNGDSETQFKLQNLASIHLVSADGNNSALRMVQIFMLVAILLLLIAGINYVNLSTARSLIRAREVSIRKIIGANKRQLFFQFIFETILLFCIATVFAIVLIFLLMPLYNDVSGKMLHFSLSDAGVWKVIGIAIVGTLMASSIYPAILLTSFNPIQAIKGKVSAGIGTVLFRKSLVVFQFAISVILIVSTLVISHQMQFIRNKNLGYDKSYVFSVPLPDEVSKKADAVKNELSKETGILNVSVSNIYNVSNIGNSTNDIEWPGKAANYSMNITQANIDKDFIPTMKMQFLEGGNFTGVPADSTHYILNEKAVKLMDIKPPYVGKEISFHNNKGTIIGVLKDFNFKSLKEEITPLIFSSYGYKNILFVRTTSKDVQQAIAATETQYKKYAGDAPFSYNFVDKQFEQLYQSDQRTGTLFNIFAGIAIFISCLGLFGLATYTAQVRTKEIGVRKVLGASIPNIIKLISSDFLKLIFIAIIIAIPVAWFGMNKWLEDYTYKVTISWWIFLIAGSVAILIALITVSFQAIKAAIANPVESLRTE
jgi:ABC-type antimicrobial peptide transport system permease subunit